MRRSLLIVCAAAVVSCATAPEREIQVLERTHGCRSPEETHRLWTLVKHDRAAAAKYSNERNCRIFAEREKVTIVDPLVVQQMNGIRIQGDSNVYYVPSAHAR
jgi:hypothetical protein